MFLGSDAKFYIFDGNQTYPVSQKIETSNGVSEFDLSKVNKSFLDKACAVDYKERHWYVCFIPLSTTNDWVIVYDYYTGAWWPMSDIQGFSCAIGLHNGQRQLFFIENNAQVEEFDNEGRYIETRLGDLGIISLYLPSGSSGPERQASKDRLLKVFPRQLAKLKKKYKNVILCGDWNIAHREIDLKNWRSNQKNSGFLPHERAWMDKLYGQYGYVDAYRVIEPETEQYTWWSNRGRARENNVGWRIDYQVITPGLADRVKKARVYTDQWFSDHAPLIIDYNL